MSSNSIHLNYVKKRTWSKFRCVAFQVTYIYTELWFAYRRQIIFRCDGSLQNSSPLLCEWLPRDLIFLSFTEISLSAKSQLKLFQIIYIFVYNSSLKRIFLNIFPKMLLLCRFIRKFKKKWLAYETRSIQAPICLGQSRGLIYCYIENLSL